MSSKLSTNVRKSCVSKQYRHTT